MTAPSDDRPARADRPARRRLPRLARLLIGLALALTGAAQAGAHALEPGFLELRALGEDRWTVYWKVPAGTAGPLPLTAVLPEACTPPRPPGLRFDGRAFHARWTAYCPGGLLGGRVLVEGLERTETDVLVRYEPTAGAAAEAQRLTPAAPGFEIPAPQGAWGVFKAYGRLGVEHILAGIDHLLFVFALLLLVGPNRRLFWAVTGFTAAHSITLALASLDVIRAPGPPVEAVIALSIMFLAAEILRLRAGGRPGLTERAPWAVSFAFGLLHGLGFAGALREIGLPRDETAMALLSFNLGVEAGQLLFIAAAMTVGLLLSRIGPALSASVTRRGGAGRAAAAYVIGGVAAVWFVERAAGL